MNVSDFKKLIGAVNALQNGQRPTLKQWRKIVEFCETLPENESDVFTRNLNATFDTFRELTKPPEIFTANLFKRESNESNS